MSHKITIPLEIGNTEISLDVSYDYQRGQPATGPTYSSGGEPGYGPEVEINSIKIGDEPAPKWFDDAAEEYVREWIFEHHEEPEREYERDDYRDASA